MLLLCHYSYLINFIVFFKYTQKISKTGMKILFIGIRFYLSFLERLRAFLAHRANGLPAGVPEISPGCFPCSGGIAPDSLRADHWHEVRLAGSPVARKEGAEDGSPDPMPPSPNQPKPKPGTETLSCLRLCPGPTEGQASVPRMDSYRLVILNALPSTISR